MKHTVRSLLCALLLLAMVLNLAACGKKDQESQDSGELVYTAASTKVTGDKIINWITPLAYTDDGLYASTSVSVPVDDVDPEDPCALSEYYISQLCFVDYEGNLRVLEDFDAPLPVEDTDNRINYYSSASLDKLFVTEDKNLVAITTYNCSWFDGTEEEYNEDLGYWNETWWEKFKNFNEYRISLLDPDGRELSSSVLDFNGNDRALNTNGCVMDAEGNLYATCEDALVVFSQDGSLQYQIPLDFWPDRMTVLPDGTIALLSYDMGGQALMPLDTAKRSMGKAIKVPSDLYIIIPGNGDYDFYYTDYSEMHLFGFDLETGESTKILDWLDLDIRGDSLSRYQIWPDGTVRGILTVWKDNCETENELITARKVPADTIPQKETLTLAVLDSYSLYDKVFEFNRHNDQVRIQIVDYSQYNDYENGDYDAGRTKLVTEIMADQMPDLIALSQLPYSQLAAKGLLEDLYPYLEKDPELSREDLFPNVLQALEVDGKLCQITSSFSVETLIGAASVVGDKPGWTYSDLQAALATMPEDCDPMNMYTVRGELLRTLLYADLDHYVDWSNGRCDFESEDFIQMLEFVAMFPDDIPDDMEWEPEAERIADRRQMLMQSWLYNMDSILWDDLQFGDTGCTYIGYPTNNGVGSIMSLEYGYGMSATCKNKEAAWQFLRGFLLPEAQENCWYIPVSQKAYQKQLKELMTPIYAEDENGNRVKDDDGNYIMYPRYSIPQEDGTEKDIYVMTQDQADRIWDAITTCTKISNWDESIYNIVYEQAQAYFSGQKTAQEVARLIQSKVTIYVNEQR